jgi:SAM-dependent methyltransferase
MRTDDLALFRSPLLPDEQLRFDGRLCDDQLGDGILSAGRHVVGYVEVGVAAFVAPNINWGGEDIRMLEEGNWIRTAWDFWREHQMPQTRDIIRQYLEADGWVVELGCGPGGGLAPRVLIENPAARIIMNDLSIRILHLQRAQIATEKVGKNVLFAAYDICESLLRPTTVAAVCSCGGLSGTGERAPEAIAAAFDALQPGGRLFVLELSFDAPEFRGLPDEVRACFGMGDPWPERLLRAGFVIESEETWKGAALDDPKDGGLAQTLIDLGVKAHKHHQSIIARKPDVVK